MNRCIAGALVSLAVTLSCLPTSSPRMSPAATRLGRAPDVATIRFVGSTRDALGASHIWTIHDEARRFLGDLCGVSSFEVHVAPGRHRFGAVSLDGASQGPFCFEGDYEAGKYYVAFFRYSEGSGAWRYGWIFPRPDSKVVDARALLAATPLQRPDVVAGQAFLAEHPPPGCLAPVAADEVNPASFGFDDVP